MRQLDPLSVYTRGMSTVWGTRVFQWGYSLIYYSSRSLAIQEEPLLAVTCPGASCIPNNKPHRRPLIFCPTRTDVIVGRPYTTQDVVCFENVQRGKAEEKSRQLRPYVGDDSNHNLSSPQPFSAALSPSLISPSLKPLAALLLLLEFPIIFLDWKLNAHE